MVENLPVNDLPSDILKQQLPDVWKWLENVSDPEVPVLTVLDLGVVRSVTISDGAFSVTEHVGNRGQYALERHSEVEQRPKLMVRITPTYTGCPAMSLIAANIRLELESHGWKGATVQEVLSPAWTTDWMSEAGKQKLLEYGIAPPRNKARLDKMLFAETKVPCPLCGSENTELISEFGSTACKALYRCLDCREPFDYFKCH